MKRQILTVDMGRNSLYELHFLSTEHSVDIYKITSTLLRHHNGTKVRRQYVGHARHTQHGWTLNINAGIKDKTRTAFRYHLNEVS